MNETTIGLGILLLLVGVGLWILSQKNLIGSKTLDTLEKIASIVAVIAALLLFIFPILDNDPEAAPTPMPPTFVENPLLAASVLVEDDFNTPNENIWNAISNWEIEEGRATPSNSTGSLFYCPTLILNNSEWDMSSISIVVDFNMSTGERNAEIIFSNEARVELHGGDAGLIRVSHGNNYEQIPTSTRLRRFEIDNHQSIQIDFYDKQNMQVFINREKVFSEPIHLQFEIGGDIGFRGCANQFVVDRFAVYSQEK